MPHTTANTSANAENPVTRHYKLIPINVFGTPAQPGRYIAWADGWQEPDFVYFKSDLDGGSSAEEWYNEDGFYNARPEPIGAEEGELRPTHWMHAPEIPIHEN